MDDQLLKGKEVRLFTSHHIKSVREAELRSTASLLSMTLAVSEFGRSVVAMAGGPKGKLRCYTEVPFKIQNGPKVQEERLDGLIWVTRGKTDWRAFVEVKVGDSLLEQDQLTRYHSLARDQSINCLITVSNQAALANGLPPNVEVDGRRLRSVPIVHFSWERLLSEAQLLSRRKGIADPDQQWMLDEWIRYIADPRSRIIEPPHMGPCWGTVLRAAREGNLAAQKPQIEEVVTYWDAFVKKLALRLRSKLGVEVQPRMTRAEKANPAERSKNLCAAAMRDGELRSSFKIPDAAGNLSLVVLLASGSYKVSIDVDAPTEGRNRTRIGWLLKQLSSEEIPESLIVRVDWDRRNLSTQGRIHDLRESSDPLLRDGNGAEIPKEVAPRQFTLEWTTRLTKGKGRSSAPVLEGLAAGVEDFYKQVIESLRPFVPRAPQLPGPGPKEGDRPAVQEATVPVVVQETPTPPGETEESL